MGQYYHIYLESVEIIGWSDPKSESLVKEEFILDPHNFCCGAKITEHSWLHNELTDTVSSILHHNICKLAWVGDYADQDIGTAKSNLTKKVFNKCWPKKSSKRENITHFEVQPKFDYTGKWLANYDKNQIISLDEISLVDCSDQKDGWYLYPVSLMTACGNGNGGGDYHGVNEKLVGTWALDCISIVDHKLEGFDVITPCFEESM